MTSSAEILGLMRLVNRLKNKFLAIILTDIEEEFKWEEELKQHANTLRVQAKAGKVDTTSLLYLLDRIDTQMPTYFMVRKTVLDGLNEFVRNIYQVTLGDVEGYGSRESYERRSTRDYRRL